jgi:hypothetical protein
MVLDSNRRAAAVADREGSAGTIRSVTAIPDWRDAHAPGVMVGHGGMIYQFLRLNPEFELRSVLTQDGPT